MTTKIRATIDIDIGGTFTDCFIRYGDQSVISKSPTTGYDLSVGFIKAIENGAELLDLDLDELLEETDMIRYSTTVAMNKLIERKGPKLGFITTEGYEDMLYIGKGSQWQDGISSLDSRKIAEVSKPIPLIPRENVVGVKERIDYTGEVIRPLDEEDFKDKLQYLVDQGVMGFVVSTLWSFKNPVHEKRIKDLIEEEYPEYYLGNMPVVLSSEVMPKRYEYTRSNMAILNAYLHQAMAEELSNIGDELRDLGYRNPLLMVHNTGGMAEVFRTSAVNTYNGGPVAGIIGSNQIGKLYDYPNIVVTDMGGTSFDIGLVVDGETNNYQFKPVIDRWLVDMTMLESKSIGTGGGSIAWINDVLGGRLEVGPRSAGSFPGPVAYDQGGTEPTVTDADLVLGYLNPDYFHGGNLMLNIEKAKQVIEEKIAKPLGVDVYEAAYLIKKVCDGNMANIIQKETSLQGNDPKDFVLFALGGGGPVHGAGFGFEADIPKTIVLQQSPVFCAFSSSMMDIMHIYEQSKHIILLEPGTKKFLTDYESLNSVVRNLQEKAIRDITGEGFHPEDIQYQLELDMKYGGQLNIKRAVSPTLFINSPEDVQNLWDSFTEEYSNAYSSIAVYPEGGVEIENVVLKATVPQEKFHFIQNEASGEDARHAIKGSRKAYWPELGGFVDTNIYQLEDLSSGNKIEGPALIESPHTTVVLPPDVVYTVDQYLNGLIEKKTVEGGNGMIDFGINERIHPEPIDEFEQTALDSLKPGEYEIYSEKLNQLVLEAKEVLTKIGVSSMLHSGDIVVGLYTAKGDLVAAYCGVYLHAVTTQIGIKYILKHYKDDPTIGINEGDIFYANEALYGGVHNPDQVAVMPIFHEGELVAWAAAAVHQPETGAIEPGGMPLTAKSRADEGMKLPPIKIGENYQIRNDMLNMMANMVSRAPRMQIIDTKARVAACDRLRVRVQQLIEKKGVDLVVGVMRKMLIVAEEGARKRISSWQDGVYRSVSFMDTMGTNDSLMRCQLTLTKEGDTLTFDFTGSSPENDGSFNSFMHIVRAHIAIYLFGVPFADLPTSSGIFSSIKVIVPQGTFLNANVDASVANSPITNSCVLSTTSNAFAKMLYASGVKELSTSGYGAGGCAVVIAGQNQWGVPFADMLANVLNSEGSGARTHRDGDNSFGFPWGWWGKAPDVEDMENEQPHVHLYFKHWKDSGGFGKYRGGAGTNVAWAVKGVPFLVYQSIIKHHKVPITQGLFGGYPPPSHPGIKIVNANYFEKMKNGDADIPVDTAELVKKRSIEGDYVVERAPRPAAPVMDGDIYVANSTGGGGYGDVLDREPENVIKDLKDELISDWVAQNIYKVSYDPETLTLDEEKTEKLRELERKDRLGRGKSYDEFIVEWSKKQPAEEALVYYGSWPNAEPLRQIVRM